MVLLKHGEALQFSSSDIKPAEIIANDEHITEQFKKIANNLKRIAPKANDFLYFSATMMHAAERNLYNDDGTIKVGTNGKPIEAHWEVNEKTGSWKWVCSDPTIRPYKNANCDIFPESELKKAYKKWVGKPLCKDHQSSSVDGVRGIILDTYYDDAQKQVIALCALDKINYGPLARAVEAGYANSVSMGTAVGRSICSECGNVARVESDYCEHVKGRTAYGEINTELSPIELSIVVNGADPLAKVRTIIAQTKFIEDSLKKSGSTTTIEQLIAIKQDFSKIANRISNLEKELVAQDDNNLALKAVAQDETAKRIQEEYNSGLTLIKNKMANVESMIQEIANKFNTEELMVSQHINKSAYYHGTEEPTPGKPQYEKEESNGIRDNEDRQMKNIADTGAIDGMFPGDLEQKKMLARAKVDERRQLRANAVAKAKNDIETQKFAYMRGTTDPTTYPVDPLGEKARKEDKQLQGITEFGKGNLTPGDEELKKKLLRAGLKARFVKAANPANNRWDILSGDSVVLSATFGELACGNSNQFEAIKTADFAKSMMKTIKERGLETASKIFKSAQAMDPMGAGLGADPMAGLGDMGAGAPATDPMAGLGGMDMGAGAPPAGAPPAGATDESSTLEGIPETVADPVERGKVALEVLEKNVSVFSANIQELITDLKAGYDTLSSQGGQLAAAGGGAAAEALAAPEATVTASLKTLQKGATGPNSTDALRNIQVVLNAGLKEAFKKTIAELNSSKEELDAIHSTLQMPGIDNVNQQFVDNLANDAMTEASEIVNKAKALQVAFIKYARGAFGLEKKAAIENKMLKLAAAKKKKDEKPSNKTTSKKFPFKKDEKEDNDEEVNTSRRKGPAPATTPAQKGAVPVPATTKAAPVKPGAAPMKATASVEDDLTTVEGRRMYRQKIASKALQMSEMLDRAHPSGSASLSGFDYKSSEAVVEDLEDIHDKMENAATNPPKGDQTKKAAEKLDALIKAGRVNSNELDDLVKHGLDKDAVAYWKKYYGQVDGGNEFVSALVSDYDNSKKASVDVEKYKVKLARAYDLAYEMADVGLITNNREAIKGEVESIVKWTDEAFDSMKRVIAHHKPSLKKEASLEVGIAFDSNVTSGAKADNSLLGELTEAFSGRNSLGRR